jgi:purine-binding chemotaxis protein CheW
MPAQMHGEQRFASFILGGEHPIELAIDAEQVLEATPVSGSILPLPASADCIEGLMQLRNDTIPVVNMKKRLALTSTAYGKDAKVAVVQLLNFRCGLLFDDIKEVLQIERDHLQPLHPALCSEDRVISNLIKLGEEGRTLEVIDLDLIFPSQLLDVEHQDDVVLEATTTPDRIRSYSRYVVFISEGQQYGVRVEQTQEITFLSDIDDMFQKGVIEGALTLRGHTIPILSAARLLQQSDALGQADEDTRILVLTSNDLQYGLIVDEVKEIVSVADDTILPLPAGGHPAVGGIIQCEEAADIMLISVDDLIQTQHDELQSMARLKTSAEQGHIETQLSETHHLITADCYLVFSLGKKYAIELNDVQEIIEAKELMTLPAASGLEQKVLNLRGTVIPVVNLGNYFNESTPHDDDKLIIGRKQGHMVALQVNHIETIYKQVQYQNTPSLNPRYQHCADILDRLIEFMGDSGIREHVLVINIEKLMQNHLGMPSQTTLSPNMLSPSMQPASRLPADMLPVEATNPDPV